MSDNSTWDVERVRRDFPILQRPLSDGRPLVYLDSAATAQKPRCVIEKVRACFEEFNSNVHRGIHELGDRMTTELEAARENVRSLINAHEVEEVIFTSGTTMSINLAAHGWGRKFLKPGDEILLNEMEHHANLVPWQLTAKATGAVLRYLPLTDEGRLDMSRLDEFLTPKTKLVAVTGMSNVLGTINPIDELARRAHDVGSLILVDAAQSILHGQIDVQRSRIDFLAFSGHKLYGPTGIGVLYGRRSLLEAMDPFLAGGHMIREVFLDHSTWADLPAKFEAGTGPFIEAVGLGAAIDYVQSLGFDAIQGYEQQLIELAYHKLRSVPGVTIYGPPPGDRGSLLSFTADGLHPHDISDLLNRRGVAVRAGHHCTMPLHDRFQLTATARASFAFYNTPGEVDALVDAMHYARKVFRLK